MKTYTDYGKDKIKSLHSCLIEIEDVAEWTALEMAVEGELRRKRDSLARSLRAGCYDTVHIERHIAVLEKILPQFEAINTIPIERFSLAAKDLWRKDEAKP